MPAGEETVFELSNEGNSIHNMHVAGGGGYDTDLCDPTDDDPCSDPPQIRGGDTGTITINIADPGPYDFRCDFHPDRDDRHYRSPVTDRSKDTRLEKRAACRPPFSVLQSSVTWSMC